MLMARNRNNSKLIVEKGTFTWRLHRHGVDEVMTKLGTVLFFFPLSSTWDRLNGMLIAARDRNSVRLIVP